MNNTSIPIPPKFGIDGERESQRQADTGSSISFLTGKGWVEGGGFPVGATVGFLTLDPARGLPAGTGCPGKFCMKGFHK